MFGWEDFIEKDELARHVVKSSVLYDKEMVVSDPVAWRNFVSKYQTYDEALNDDRNIVTVSYGREAQIVPEGEELERQEVEYKVLEYD